MSDITNNQELAEGITKLVKLIRDGNEDPPFSPDEQASFIRSILYLGKKIRESKPWVENELLKALNDYSRLASAGTDVACYGSEIVEVETGRTPVGKSVLYVHVNGITKLRVCGYKGHKVSDKAKELRIASLTDLRETARKKTRRKRQSSRA